jgi:hypothetical protein
MKPVDLVFDLVGGNIPRRSCPLLRPGGALGRVVGRADLARPPGGVRVIFFVVEPDLRLLVEIAHRIDNHELCPKLGRTFDLEDGARAFEAKAAGGIAGKVASKVNADRSWVQPAGLVAR